MTAAVEKLAVKAIKKLDNQHFEIEWLDGRVMSWSLAQLQRNCPCANCVNEQTGERRKKDEEIPEDLEAVSLKNVGRYALRLQFKSGCSAGIYSFDYLCHLSQK